MNRHERYLNQLAALAEDLEPVGSASIAAAIVIDNKVVSYGFNSNKTHPMQKRYGRNKEAIYKHAEIDALFKALKKIDVADLRRATLYVARMKKAHKYSIRKNTPGMACPCSGCQRAISTFGIKRVVYTKDDSGYEITNM